MEWDNIDWLEFSRYIALNWSLEQCRKSKLRRILPTRRKTGGSRPGIKGVGPRGRERGDTEQWIFPQVNLEDHEKKELIAVVVEIVTQALFNKHYYTFGGKYNHQRVGGPMKTQQTKYICKLKSSVHVRPNISTSSKSQRFSDENNLSGDYLGLERERVSADSLKEKVSYDEVIGALALMVM